MEEAVTEASDKAHEFTDSVHKGVDELQQRGQEMLAKAKK